jgi:tRNA(Ile2) C34 agmatinyltransferase TiaS
MTDKYKRGDQQNQKRPVQNKEKEGAKKMAGKKCQHCGGEMRARGAADGVGSISWKCRKCGRTLWIRHELTAPPIPLTYTDKRHIC